MLALEVKDTPATAVPVNDTVEVPAAFGILKVPVNVPAVNGANVTLMLQVAD